MLKLWDKGTATAANIEQFTIGHDQALDLKLAKYDVIGSIAHSRMLLKTKLLSADDQNQLELGLLDIFKQIENGSFAIAEGIEDVHSQIEWLLTNSLGDIGKKIHTARSRNDQVLVDLRLFFRAEIEDIVLRAKQLFDILILQSEKHKTVLMPGYTHMQVAMVSSFGLWFGAFAESIIDDLRIMQGAYQVINQNPLGSGAGFGSSLPIDRQVTTQLLGFEDLSYNSVNAQMGRGKSELFLSFGMAALAGTINKLASDVCLFMGQNFGFFELPDELTTGSSIMPHKKNPDVFELVRAKCTQLLTLPQQVISLTTNLPSGYHRDFQVLKEVIFPSVNMLKDVLGICHFAIGKLSVKDHIMDNATYKYLFTVEEVNKLVEQGVPFREAYRNISDAVESGTFMSDRKINHTHQGSIGNLCNNEIHQKMTKVLAGFPFEQVNKSLAGLLSRS